MLAWSRTPAAQINSYSAVYAIMIILKSLLLEYLYILKLNHPSQLSCFPSLPHFDEFFMAERTLFSIIPTNAKFKVDKSSDYEEIP